MAKLNDYLQGRENALRNATLQLTSDQEQEILQAYLKSGQQLIKKIAKTADPTKRAVYVDYAYEIHRTTTNIIKKYSLEAAVNTLDSQSLLMLEMLAEKGAAKEALGFELNKLVNTRGEKLVESLIRGNLYKDGYGLSERIWKSSVTAGTNIQSIVAGALANGTGAAELSKMLEAYVDPAVRRTWDFYKIEGILGKGYAVQWKNLEYNALRLARTTISHSVTQSWKESAGVNPFIKKVKWNSVHAAGRTCDVCISMDGNIYTLDELPFDHPNGLCYMTHVFDESMDQMADRLAGWVNNPESDNELETWWQSRPQD